MSDAGYLLAVRTTGLFLLTWSPTATPVSPYVGRLQYSWFVTAGGRNTFLAALQVDDPTVDYTEYNLAKV